MEEHNILCIANRSEFRAWLEAHHASERECWVDVKRGRPVDDKHFWYLDAVEEALCFGWIDSRHKLIDGKRMQCFTPRKRNSPWTELNKERVRRLERLGLMTDAGRKVLPPMGVRSFKIDKDVETALKSARVWTTFKSFPSLYQRIRAYNVAFYKTRDKGMYEQTLLHFITETKAGRMFGEWNDYGRLLDYLIPCISKYTSRKRGSPSCSVRRAGCLPLPEPAGKHSNVELGVRPPHAGRFHACKTIQGDGRQGFAFL